MTIDIPPDVEAGSCELAREWGATIEQATLAVLVDRVKPFIPPFRPRTDRDRPGPANRGPRHRPVSKAFDEQSARP